MDQHQADNCQCHKQNCPAQQTLSEVDFDRGIWNAAIYNEKERIRGFIAKGKSMDRDNCDYTALHYAARNGHLEICELLIDDGKCDVNAVTKGGVTALHRAAMTGQLDVVKLLVEKGAKLDLQDSDGRTPLHRAAMMGHSDVLKLLVKKGAKFDIQDRDGRTPCEYGLAV